MMELEDQEWSVSWKVKQLVQDARLKGELEIQDLSPQAFSFVLDLLRYEHFHELQQRSGFYLVRESLTVAFSKKHIYGLHLTNAKTIVLLVEELKLTPPFSSSSSLEMQRFYDRFVHCLMDGFLPFFCGIDEDNLGSIEHLWTFKAFRKLGLASYFLSLRFVPNIQIGKVDAVMAEDADQTTWFWNQFEWVNLISPVYISSFENLRKKAMTQLRPSESPASAVSTEEIDSIIVNGIIEKRIFGFTNRNKLSDKILDYFCVLDSQGRKKLDWTHESLKSWRIGQKVDEKRMQKYVKIVLEDAIPFWEKRGFVFLEVA